MRTYTVTEYDEEDIEKLHGMSNKEVAEVLQGIKRGWLPQNYDIHGIVGKTYSEDQYEASKLHIAINKAILLLEEN